MSEKKYTPNPDGFWPVEEITADEFRARYQQAESEPPSTTDHLFDALGEIEALVRRDAAHIHDEVKAIIHKVTAKP